jgi:DNA-binding NarL/FixJ family response regulator
MSDAITRQEPDDQHERVVRVVLADDHPVVREGLRLLVDAQPDMQVVGEAADGEAACRLTSALQPDILVIDMSMPVLGGADATARVRQECPGVKVLALTVHEERAYLTQLLRAGASGYVLKRAAPSELVHAMRTVAAGGTYIDPSLTGTLIEGYLDAEAAADAPTPDVLSDREREVLMRIAQGFSNKEIAAALALSVKTVETYKARVSEKLALRSRVDMVRYAARQGWLSTSTEPDQG